MGVIITERPKRNNAKRTAERTELGGRNQGQKLDEAEDPIKEKTQERETRGDQHKVQKSTKRGRGKKAKKTRRKELLKSGEIKDKMERGNKGEEGATIAWKGNGGKVKKGGCLIGIMSEIFKQSFSKF